MIYLNKKKHQSKLTGFEDVFFTLRKMTEGRRNELRLATAEHNKKLREATAKIAMLVADVPEDAKIADLEPGKRTEYLNALSEQEQIIADLDRTWLTWGLLSIEGLKDGDNKDLNTADLLIDEGPEELFKEIVGMIRSEATLTEAQSKN